MTKLNRLITNWPRGLVYTSTHLKEKGYSPALLAQYKKNKWIKSLGRGAVVRKGDPLDWRGGLVALQKQLGLEVHVAARTALEMHGVTHFLEADKKVVLFGKEKTRLPAWFSSTKWGQEINYFSTKLFSTDIGLQRHKVDNFSFAISSRERALFEQLYLVPHEASFRDSALLFQGLYTLRSDLVQNLLLECQSIKVKRLFMVIAEEFDFPWARKLDLVDVDFGRGNRLIDPGGKTHPKYNITVDMEPFDLV